jgi:hypothetical protein
MGRSLVRLTNTSLHKNSGRTSANSLFTKTVNQDTDTAFQTGADPTFRSPTSIQRHSTDGSRFVTNSDRG